MKTNNSTTILYILVYVALFALFAFLVVFCTIC
jgi:hypothetical protein